MNDAEALVRQLNAGGKEERLDALRQLRSLLDSGQIEKPQRGTDTNNHVHTTYSFSPYSPTAAVWKAYQSGLETVGIVDHDTIAGAREFIEAGDILGITTTIGAEVRVSFAGTPFAGRTLNNPDEPTVAYIALHGVPHTRIEDLDRLLSRVRTLRNERNRIQTQNLNALLAGTGIELDFERDVLPLSEAAEGGSVTERHILYALAEKIEEKTGRGEPLIAFLENNLGLPVQGRAAEYLRKTDTDTYAFDVLNVLKSGLVPRFFVAAGPDSLPVEEVLSEVRSLGAIPTYCYLGDVGESPTGDKKAQKFEDDFLDDLFPVLKELGFEAVAYMPSRNTDAQLERVMRLCEEYGFLQISGEDINQPRQSFICEKLRDPAYAHLATGTWALVGHEHRATRDPADGIYSKKTKSVLPDLQDRLRNFEAEGRKYRR